MRCITLQFPKSEDWYSCRFHWAKNQGGSRGESILAHPGCWQNLVRVSEIKIFLFFSSFKLRVIQGFWRRPHFMIQGLFLPFLIPAILITWHLSDSSFTVPCQSLSLSLIGNVLFLRTHMIRLGLLKHSRKLSIQRSMILITSEHSFMTENFTMILWWIDFFSVSEVNILYH